MYIVVPNVHCSSLFCVAAQKKRRNKQTNVMESSLKFATFPFYKGFFIVPNRNSLQMIQLAVCASCKSISWNISMDRPRWEKKRSIFIEVEIHPFLKQLYAEWIWSILVPTPHLPPTKINLYTICSVPASMCRTQQAFSGLLRRRKHGHL